MAEMRDTAALPDFFSDSSFWTPEWRHVRSRSHEHAPFLFWLLGVLQPGSAVEVGSRWGVSYLALCQGVKRLGTGATCRAMCSDDLEFEAGFAECHRAKYGNFSTLEGMTSGADLVSSAGKPVDLLMIDGESDHRCLAEASELWSSMISKTGIALCFGIEGEGTAARLWKKWAAAHPHFEFPHGGGLGVVGMGSEVPSGLRPLLAMPEPSPAAQLVQRLYAGLGQKISAEAALSREQSRFEQWLRDGARSLQQHGLETKAEISRAGLAISASQGALRLRDLRVKELEGALKDERASAEAELGKLESRLQSLCAELQAERNANRDLTEESRKFQAALDEVEVWQKSWFRRAFTRWHRTRSDAHPHFVTRWVRSLQKRCSPRS